MIHSGYSDSSGVGDFAMTNSSHIRCSDGYDGDGFAIQRDEFHFVASLSMCQHDRAHVTLLESVVGQIALEHHSIEFADHFVILRTGYAVTNLGTVRPLSGTAATS